MAIGISREVVAAGALLFGVWLALQAGWVHLPDFSGVNAWWQANQLTIVVLAAAAVMLWWFFFRKPLVGKDVLNWGDVFTSLAYGGWWEKSTFEIITRYYMVDHRGGGFRGQKLTTDMSLYRINLKKTAPNAFLPDQAIVLLDCKRFPNPPGGTRLRGFGSKKMFFVDTGATEDWKFVDAIQGFSKNDYLNWIRAGVESGDISQDIIPAVFTSGAGVPQKQPQLGG